jgi:hypothetical protein
MAKKSTPDETPLPAIDAMTQSAPVKEALIIRAPGIYEISDTDYHADPCVRPSLSRSVLKRLVDLSPAHAYVMHPKLGGADDLGEGSEDEAMDIGTAAHSSFLQSKSILRSLDFNDWRTNKAKEARTLAYADGMIPLLMRAYNRAMRVIDRLEDFRNRTGAFTHGKPEQTLVWQEDDEGVWCRARVDWLPDDPASPLWDLKSTASAAAIGPWSRAAFDKGVDLQAALYPRGAEMIREEPPEGMYFCVIEQKPPYGIRVFQMSPIALDIANQKIRAGISLWGNCLATGQWPGWSPEAEYVHPPSWIIREWEDRSALSQRSLEIAREIRERPLAVQFVESGDFGA